MSERERIIHQPEWSPHLECGGVAVDDGVPVWCEAHMQQFGHRRGGDPVLCECGGQWATKATYGQHNHNRPWEPLLVHRPLITPTQGDI